MSSVNNEPKEKFSISGDIIVFLKKLNLNNFNIKSILQLDRTENDILFNISKKILICLYELNNLDDINEIINNSNLENLKKDKIFTISENELKKTLKEEDENIGIINEDIKDYDSDKDNNLEDLLKNFKRNIDSFLKDNFQNNSNFKLNVFNDNIKLKKKDKKEYHLILLISY